MEITTKFDIRQTVYVIAHNEIKSFEVYEIVSTTNSGGKTSHSYTASPFSTTNPKTNFFEPSIYATKKEAAEAWLKQQGLEVGLV